MLKENMSLQNGIPTEKETKKSVLQRKETCSNNNKNREFNNNVVDNKRSNNLFWQEK